MQFNTTRRFLSSTTIINTTKKLKVYGFPISQPTRSVLLLCNENNIPFEKVLIDVHKLDHLKPEFKKMHPAGLLPVISDDEFILGESAAILQYLAESRNLSNWYPTDPQDRARVNFWLHWHHNSTRKGTKEILVPKTLRATPDEEKFKRGVKAVTRAVDLINNHLAGTGNKYLASAKHPTIADLLILPELDQLGPKAFNFFNFEPYTHVQQYVNNLTKELKSYNENFEPVVAAAEKYHKKGNQ